MNTLQADVFYFDVSAYERTKLEVVQSELENALQRGIRPVWTATNEGTRVIQLRLDSLLNHPVLEISAGELTEISQDDLLAKIRPLM